MITHWDVKDKNKVEETKGQEHEFAYLKCLVSYCIYYGI